MSGLFGVVGQLPIQNCLKDLFLPHFFPCYAISFPLCQMSSTNPTCLVPSDAKINSSSHFVLLAMLLIRLSLAK